MRPRRSPNLAITCSATLSLLLAITVHLSFSAPSTLHGFSPISPNDSQSADSSPPAQENPVDPPQEQTEDSSSTSELDGIEITAKDLPGLGARVSWRGDWLKARAEARERNVPIFLVVHRDGDQICEGSRAALWNQRELAQFVDSECVPVALILPPNEGTKPHLEICESEDRLTLAHCSVIPNLRCEDHQSLLLAVDERFRQGTEKLPERWLLNWNEEILAEPNQLPPGMDIGHLKDAIADARRELGTRRLTCIEYRHSLIRLDRIERSIQIREYRTASLELQAVKRLFQVLPDRLIERANKLRSEVRTEAQRLTKRAQTYEEKSPIASLQIYKSIFKMFPGIEEGEAAGEKLAAHRAPPQ